MEADFKLINSILEHGLKPSILKIYINQIANEQTIKEIIVLDRKFYLWLDKTEIEIFLNEYNALYGYKMKSIKRIGKEFEPIINLYEPVSNGDDNSSWILNGRYTNILDNCASEYAIWYLIGQIFFLNKNNINELMIYDFDNFTNTNLNLDTISLKTKGGILTTKETIDWFKKIIIDTYNAESDLQIYMAARFLELKSEIEENENENENEEKKEKKKKKKKGKKEKKRERNGNK